MQVNQRNPDQILLPFPLTYYCCTKQCIRAAGKTGGNQSEIDFSPIYSDIFSLNSERVCFFGPGPDCRLHVVAFHPLAI
jgi:hypothetical protein